MTKQERMEKSIPMSVVYGALIKDEKEVNTYEKRLNHELQLLYSNRCKIKHVTAPFWYTNKEHLEEEYSFKLIIIDELSVLKERISYFKKTEALYIDADVSLNKSQKQSLKKVLNKTIKNFNLKMEIVKNQFQIDIENLKNTANTFESKIISGLEEEQMKLQIFKIKNDIETYCYENICNDEDLTQMQKLKTLTKIYTPAVAKTILENSCDLNASSIDKAKQLAETFISALNENIKLEKMNV